MTTTFEKLSSNKVKLGFVVEPEKFEEGIRTADLAPASWNVFRFVKQP